MLTIEDRLSVPATLETLQVYFALSCASAPIITKALSSLIKTLPLSSTRTPSFCQVTEGVGTPLTGHLMVMVVLEAAVTLSPTFIATGLPSPTGISRPVLGTSITGFTGSVCIKEFVSASFMLLLMWHTTSFKKIADFGH